MPYARRSIWRRKQLENQRLLNEADLKDGLDDATHAACDTKSYQAVQLTKRNCAPLQKNGSKKKKAKSRRATTHGTSISIDQYYKQALPHTNGPTSTRVSTKDLSFEVVFINKESQVNIVVLETQMQVND